MIDGYELMERVLADPAALEEYARHPDWRVRYACAVAMGESGDPRWLPWLRDLLGLEAGRQLYSQPRVEGFVGSYDDTRMAEQIVAVEVIFDRDYPEELKDDWRCRGRVRQACLLAVHDIGTVTPELLRLIHDVLDDPDEDYAVKTAGAKALGRVGDERSVPFLEKALAVDEWCLNVEARKALASIVGAADA